MIDTPAQFDHCIQICRDVFSKKLSDYGASWRILRPKSATDQLLIKAMRIRSIEEKKKHKIEEGIHPEFVGLINYSIIALIQLSEKPSYDVNTPIDKVLALYDYYALESKNLMLNKNHDYDEAWRKMRISSYTDLILTKLFRIKQIEDNEGVTKISEGIEANYFDIINYAIFGLIQLEFTN